MSATELGLRERLQLLPVANPTIPTARNPQLALDNPLSKVPALVLSNGERLFDSIVICEYLDALDGEHRLFPPTGMLRWRALRLNALADGITEAGIAVRLERVRPAELRWDAWVEGHLFKIVSALDMLESDFDSWHFGLTIGHIALACALQWLDFREIAPNLRVGHDRLYGWLGTILQRPSFTATVPA